LLFRLQRYGIPLVTPAPVKPVVKPAVKKPAVKKPAPKKRR
jgi:hypothetical protein